MPSLSNTSLELLSQFDADDDDFSGCVPPEFLARGMTVSPPPPKVSRAAGDLERPPSQPPTQSRPDAGASSASLPGAQQSGGQETTASANDQAQSAPGAAADDIRPTRAAAAIDHEALQLYKRRPDLDVGAFAETLRAAGWRAVEIRRLQSTFWRLREEMGRLTTDLILWREEKYHESGSAEEADRWLRGAVLKYASAGNPPPF